MRLSGHHLERQLRGAYRIERKIGQGGMGEVWAARDLALACPVAIKVLDETLRDDAAFVRRFEQEMRMLARLRHPRIVQVMAAGWLSEDGRLFMVMELLAGKTMRDKLRERRLAGEVPDPEIAAYRAYQILDALGAAHDAGIVHRDVKPDNVMVDAAGELKLLDFGVAKAVERTGPLVLGAGRERTSTNGSTVLGTAPYVAPELVAGLGGDARGDLYAVGILLLMELTGEYPYPVDLLDQAAVLRAHLEMAPRVRRETNPHCPPALWAFALKLIEKEPAARWPTAAQARDVLSALLRRSSLPEELRGASVQKVVAEHKAGVVRAIYAEAALREASAEEPDRPTLPMGTRTAGESPGGNAGAEGAERTAPLGKGFVVKSPAANAGAEGPERTAPLGKGFVVKSPAANVTRPMHVREVRRPLAEAQGAAAVNAPAMPVKAEPVLVRAEPVPAATTQPKSRVRGAEVMSTIVVGFGVVSVVVAAIWRSAGATVEVTRTTASATATATATPSATAAPSVTTAPSVTAVPSATAPPSASATAPAPASATVTASAKVPSARVTASAPAPTRRSPVPENKLPPLPFRPQ
jgi:serine/threonine protein kinase